MGTWSKILKARHVPKALFRNAKTARIFAGYQKKRKAMSGSVLEIPVPGVVSAVVHEEVLPNAIEVILYSVIYYTLALLAGVALNHLLPKPKPTAKLAEAGLQVALHVAAISVAAWLITRIVGFLPIPDIGGDAVNIGAAKSGGVLFAGAILAAQPSLHDKVDIFLRLLGSHWKWVAIQ